MNDIWLKALLLATIFGAVLLAVGSVVRWLATSHSEGRAINLRLKLISQGRTHGEALQLLKRTDSMLPEGMPGPVVQIARRIERTLQTAQVTIPTPRLMLLLVLAPFVLLFGILLVMVATDTPVGVGRLLLIATFSFVLGGLLPLLALQIRANQMRKKMQDQFPVALDVFVRGLRAGHPIAAALDLLTVEMPDPIGSQFGIVIDEVTYGAELRDALHSLAERWDLNDMRMFVVSLSVQSETGGNLAEILENLSKVIRERQSLMMKVRALSSEGRMTAIILTALPILAFTSLFTFNPEFYLDVADDPAFVPGFVALIGLYVTGYMMIRRMVNLKV